MNSQKYKKISLFIHIGLAVLGVLMPTFALFVSALLLAEPLLYMVASIGHSHVLGSDDTSFDTYVFWAHAIINVLAKLLPVPLFTAVFVLNMIASLHYIAHVIEFINSPSTILYAQFANASDFFRYNKTAEDFRALAVFSFAKNATVDNVLAANIL